MKIHLFEFYLDLLVCRDVSHKVNRHLKEITQSFLEVSKYHLIILFQLNFNIILSFIILSLLILVFIFLITKPVLRNQELQI